MIPSKCNGKSGFNLYCSGNIRKRKVGTNLDNTYYFAIWATFGS